MHPKESLDIIAKMMNDTRLNVIRGAVAPLLAWGWASFIVSLIVWLGHGLSYNKNWDYVWFMIPLFGIILLRQLKQGEETFLSSSLIVIWKMLTILIVIFSFISYIVSYNVLSVILVILAIGSFITGELIRFPFLKYSSIPGFILAASLWWVTGRAQILIFAITMLVMLVIPGYRIKQELKKENYERA